MKTMTIRNIPDEVTVALNSMRYIIERQSLGA